MKILTLTSFSDTPEFHNVIDVINNSSYEDTIKVELKNNEGGDTYLGGKLINTIKSSKANIILIIDGMVASTAAFVWMWIYHAKNYDYFSNVKTSIKNNNAIIVCHRPRYIKDGKNIFIDDMEPSEIPDSFIKYVKEFDSSFVWLLENQPEAKIYTNTNFVDSLSNEDAFEIYSSNKDVVVMLTGFENK